MYGWGSDDAENWHGSTSYKFDSARAPYLDDLAKDAARKGPRTYTSGSDWNAKLVDPKGKTISSTSENPIVIGVDVTGSMASWPAEIFDRLPLLYQTLSQYRPDVEISFGAIGDATTDRRPLQVNDFGKGVALEENIKALYAEGGGGGQISESYELFAHFMNTHCDIPKAKSPFLLIFGDEKFYGKIAKDSVESLLGDRLEGNIDSLASFKKLMQKFNVYYLHKPYNGGGESSVDKEVVHYWADAIGKERIIELPSAERAVDVALGLIAKSWGQYDDFKENLDARQDDKALKESVHRSLRYIATDKSTASVADKKTTSKKTKSLSEMFKDAKN